MYIFVLFIYLITSFLIQLTWIEIDNNFLSDLRFDLRIYCHVLFIIKCQA